MIKIEHLWVCTKMLSLQPRALEPKNIHIREEIGNNDFSV